MWMFSLSSLSLFLLAFTANRFDIFLILLIIHSLRSMYGEGMAVHFARSFKIIIAFINSIRTEVTCTKNPSKVVLSPSGSFDSSL